MKKTPTIDGPSTSVFVSRYKPDCTSVRDGLKRQGISAVVRRSEPSGEYKVVVAFGDRQRAQEIVWD